MIVSIFLDQKYHGSIDIITRYTFSTINNVNRLSAHYRSLIRHILNEQAEAGALTICPDLWTDIFKKLII